MQGNSNHAHFLHGLCGVQNSLKSARVELIGAFGGSPFWHPILVHQHH